MAEYKKLQSVEDIPQSLTQLTHDWMVDYVLAQGNPENAAALLAFEEANQEKWSSNLKYIMKTDIKAMRQWFCEKYFPALLKNKSKKAKESNLEYSRSKLAELAVKASQKPASASPKKK